ncbi:MAG TPA: hypothetical protein VFS43_15950 [Polyangiaceae bacterium]|nr:hypothetical protein [Polyangiaceae bacterium]
MAAPLAPRGAALKRSDPIDVLAALERPDPGEAPTTAERPNPAEVLAALELSRRPGMGAASFKRLLALHLTPRRALTALDASAGRGETPDLGGAGGEKGTSEAGGARKVTAA